MLRNYDSSIAFIPPSYVTPNCSPLNLFSSIMVSNIAPLFLIRYVSVLFIILAGVLKRLHSPGVRDMVNKKNIFGDNPSIAKEFSFVSDPRFGLRILFKDADLYQSRFFDKSQTSGIAYLATLKIRGGIHGAVVRSSDG